MNIVCAICSELLIQSDEIFHTPCGHIFHFTCLGKWLERSTTCPQCRERTTTRTIHRVYFNFFNDSSVMDSTFLQSRVDSLSFQLTQKDKNIAELKEENMILEGQIDGLRNEIKRIETEMRSKTNTISALREQIIYYKNQCVDMEHIKKQLEQSRKDVQKLQNVQTLIDASTDDINATILAQCYTSNPTSIVTYLSVMKKELHNNFSRRRELREKVTSLERDLMKIKFEHQNLLLEKVKRIELEEILAKRESEKVALQIELTTAYNSVCDTVPAKKQKCLEGRENHNVRINNDKEKFVTSESINTADTPKNIKSQGFFSMRNEGAIKKNQDALKRSTTTNATKVPSILAKKSKLSQLHQKTVGSGMTFDGFGGHAKYDKFPSPLKKSHIKKVKNQK